MKSVQKLQEADLHHRLQHKIGEQLRAMYADESYLNLPPRLLDLLRDFEQVETRGTFRQRGIERKRQRRGA